MLKRFERDVTKRQAKRLVDISNSGKCAGKEIPKEIIDHFVSEGKLSLVEAYLPNAVPGVRKQITLLSKLGITDSVRDYFFKEHNASLSVSQAAVIKKTLGQEKIDPKKASPSEIRNVIMRVKKSPASAELEELESCKLKVGKVEKSGEGKFTVKFPNGTKRTFEGKPEGKYVMVHWGRPVGKASMRDYHRYKRNP